jgi:hypothetical protein
VEALDALFHQSLAWIMESDITDASLDLSFTVNEELGGQVRVFLCIRDQIIENIFKVYSHAFSSWYEARISQGTQSATNFQIRKTLYSNISNGCSTQHRVTLFAGK